MPGDGLAHGPVCSKKKQAAVTTGSAKIIRHSCAMVSTVSFVVSPGTGLDCPRRARDHRLGALDTSVGVSGPHDFAGRLGHVRLLQRPPHPHLRYRDDRDTPLVSRRDMRAVLLIC
jgi:hypothetical protein